MSDKPPPLDPVEVLHYIKTLAATAQESTNMDVAQEHIEMILTLMDKALHRHKNPAGMPPC
jgi:hypothetical protein